MLFFYFIFLLEDYRIANFWLFRGQIGPKYVCGDLYMYVPCGDQNTRFFGYMGYERKRKVSTWTSNVLGGV